MFEYLESGNFRLHNSEQSSEQR